MVLRPLPNIIRQQAANYVKVSGKSSVLQTFPAKSDFSGLKLGVLDRDNLVLKKKYSSQGEKLKDFYNSKGYPYLLPPQEWSDKKIMDAVELLGKDIDKMIGSKSLNKKSLQANIDKLIPEVKGKIIIKDFSDLENDMRAQKYSEDVIKDYLQNAGAVTDPKPQNAVIYLKFKPDYKTKWDKIHFKVDVEHELKHALSSRLQNVNTTNICKNESYKCQNQDKNFNEIFSLFETNYYRQPYFEKKALTQENMLKNLGFHSIKALHSDFEQTLNATIDWAKANGQLNIKPSKQALKHFFNQLRHIAIDEKQAYGTAKVYRELDGKMNNSLDCELDPLKYAEMEKFFNQKRIQVNKQKPNY